METLNMSDNLPKKILIVDNDRGAINTATQLIAAYKINVMSATDWGSALYIFNQNKFDLVIAALKIEEMSGSVLIQKWRQHQMAEKRLTAFIVAVSNQATPKDSALLTELGDIQTVDKPYKIGSLLSAMAAAMQKRTQNMLLTKIELESVEPEFKAGRPEQAAAIAKSQLEHVNEKGFFKSALIHERANLDERALEMFTKLSDKSPNNMSYLNEIGRLHLKKGETSSAKAAFQKADSVAPYNIRRVREMAYLYLKTQEPDRSVEKFKELIKLHPEEDDLKFEAYNAIFEAGFKKHARDFCKETSTPKELVRHFNNKGVMLAKDQQYDDAIAEYQHAVDLIPGHKELYRILYNMALSYINLKKQIHIEKAHETLKESLKLRPDFEKAQEKLKLTAKYLKKDPNE